MENQTQLTMSDMASLVTLVEVACARGAFRATEMTQVGSVYDRLKQFVDQGTAPESPAVSAPAGAETNTQGEDHA